MKIYKRDAFMVLPAGTVFFDYSPHISGVLAVKLSGPDKGPGDFYRKDIDAISGLECINSAELSDQLEDMCVNGTTKPLVFDSGGRDGMFDDDALFAVLDSDDVEAMIRAITCSNA